MGRRKKPEKKASFVKKNTRKGNSKNVQSKEKKSVKAFSRLLGMKDSLVSEYRVINPIIKKIEDMATNYSFNKIETPIIENFFLYKKLLDKNKLKSLFLLDQSGPDKFSLRPDLIHGMSRALIEHNVLNTQEKPSKFFSIGPVFKKEKVRGGVYRQFNQFNFSIFNDNKASSDAFLIFVINNIFKELQIEFQIQINNMGDLVSQKEFLAKFLRAVKNKDNKKRLCPECKKNLTKNPVSLLECQEESCVALRNDLPQIIDFISEDSSNRFYKVLEFLDEMDVPYNFNPYLIKDLGSYNDLIFEFWPIDKDGNLNSKLSFGRGGRYDNLFPNLTSRDLPILSFNGGIERIAIKLKEADQLFEEKRNDNVFLAQVDSKAKIKSMFLFKELLNKGYRVSQAFHLDDLKSQMEEAKNFKANIILILGKKEIADETIIFRDTDSGIQEIIAQKDLINRLEKNIKTC